MNRYGLENNRPPLNEELESLFTNTAVSVEKTGGDSVLVIFGIDSERPKTPYAIHVIFEGKDGIQSQPGAWGQNPEDAVLSLDLTVRAVVIERIKKIKNGSLCPANASATE